MTEAQEEARAVSKGDLLLLWRFWPLARPFWRALALAVIMIVAASAVSLLLPYLTKVAIDRYILPLGRVMRMESVAKLPEPLQERLKNIKSAGVPGLWLLNSDESALIDKREERALASQGFLDENRWYFASLDGPLGPKTKAAGEIKELLPESLLLPQALAVREIDLPKVPGAAALVLRGADITGLKRLALIFAVLMILGYGLDLSQRYFMESASQRFGHNLRETLLAHLFGLKQAFFDRAQTAWLTSRLTSDINNINAMIKSTAASFFSDILSLAGVVAIMAVMSPKLALTALVLTPAAFFLSWRFGNIARTIQRDLRAKVSAINQAFSEIAAGMAVIKAFRREKKTGEEFNLLNDENYQTGLRQVHSVAIFLPLVDLCSNVVLALILWVGGLAVIDNTASLGVLAAFVGYSSRFFNPIKDLAEKVNTFQGAFASMERIAELLDANEKLPSPPQPVIPPKPGGHIELKNVSLRYDESAPMVLDGVDLAIERGESVALVGETGSGKTSLISLLLRFYDPTLGEVLFDGVNLKNLDLERHRRRIGLVTQDVYLYSASVIDNLRLGRNDLREEAVIEAAKAVGAHDFISALPSGYNEGLGPGGRGLSAGQRQLIACARALIEAPELVILDEATAFVDSETELLIERAMMTLFKGRTSIVIAHRLSTIRRVDRIIVMRRGRLVESGNHESLMEMKGIYYHMATLQSLAETGGALGLPEASPHRSEGPRG
ncbi:MAG: ABC transporter ATP-binding protein/permease [Deltaproteobacteria bacterium]|jgi:ABC-type multidrug transport system fused ATPase/permease subunit|nr:ABC transporter ATP-binding protein/permease [Deltaproteobacteria bacterium]